MINLHDEVTRIIGAYGLEARRLVREMSGTHPELLRMSGPNEDAAKLAKTDVGFEHPAQGSNHCGMCKHYEPPFVCRIVAGTVRRFDWCKRFSKK